MKSRRLGEKRHYGLSSLAWVLAVDAREFTTDLSSTAPIFPSVASVISVRCNPLWAGSHG